MNNKGFTLIELIMIIILLGILSATAVVLVGNILEQQKFDETVKEMNELKNAIVGNPDLIESGVRSSFGYVGDMGALPANLNGLVTNPAACSWTGDTSLGGGTNLGTGAGWRGPYIDNKQDDSGNFLALMDGWGKAYSYDAATGRVGSGGPNRTFGGFATPDSDDIIIPQTSIGTIKGNVSGRLTTPGGDPIQAPPATNNVIIYGPPLTCPTTFRRYAGASNADGFYNISSIPMGKHKLSATVGGTYIDRVVTVTPNANTSMDIAFTTAAATPDISDVTTISATPLSTSTIRLNWSPPVTTNVDGSTIRDLKGYNIYRGLAAGPTSLYAFVQNNQTTGAISFIDSSAAYFNTYYYRLTAVNNSGIESNFSGDVSAPGSYGSDTILQTSEVTGWGGTTLTFNVYNNTGAALTVTRMRVCWASGSENYTAITINGGADLLTTNKNNCTAASDPQFTDKALNAGSNTIAVTFSAAINEALNVGTIDVTFYTAATNYTITDLK